MVALEEDQLKFDERSLLDFVLALRQRWADTVYPALRKQYEDVTNPKEVRSLEQATNIVHDLPLYPWFSWMERAQQKMLWRTTGDAVMNQASDLRPLPAARPENPTGTLDRKSVVQ